MHEYGRHPTHDGRTLRLLTRIEEYTRECLAIRVERRMGSQEGIETLADVSLWRGIPEYIRSDNGPEFIAQQLRPCLAKVGDRDTVHRAWKPVGGSGSGPDRCGSLWTLRRDSG